MLESVGWFISLSFGVLGVACWFAMAYFGIRARILRKPGVSWFSAGFSSGLTDAGVRAMKCSWACVLGFLVCWLLAVGIGITTGAFEGVARQNQQTGK